MADGPGLETYANHTNAAATTPAASEETPSTAAASGDSALRRTLLIVGIAAASAGLAFAIVRVTLTRRPSDPTTERIQQLIDEANRLLKQLDDKKPD